MAGEVILDSHFRVPLGGAEKYSLSKSSKGEKKRHEGAVQGN